MRSYTEKAPNAWNRRGTQRQETPIINPIDCQPKHLTDQAPSTIDRFGCELVLCKDDVLVGVVRLESCAAFSMVRYLVCELRRLTDV